MSLLSVAGFTNLGYRFHSRGFDEEGADLGNKVVMVTGATGGIGRSAAAAVRELGATVILVARDAGKLAETQEAIPGSLRYRADLSSMADVRRLAEEVLDSETRLDVLINNVGVLFPERRTTVEGIEATLATNLAGQFLLTNLLLPLLARSGPSRVVSVTSGGMYTARISPGKLLAGSPAYRGAQVYAQTKRGQVILTEMWSEKLEGSGVVFHSMHPGWVKTQGVRVSLPTFNRVMYPLLRSPEQGADTVVWLASADEPLRSNGKLWFDRRQVPTHLKASTRENDEARERLWEGLVEITGSDIPMAGR